MQAQLNQLLFKNPKALKAYKFVAKQRAAIKRAIANQLPWLVQIKAYLIKHGLLKDDPFIQSVMITLFVTLAWMMLGALFKGGRLAGRLGLVVVQVAIFGVFLGLAVQYKTEVSTFLESLLKQ